MKRMEIVPIQIIDDVIVDEMELLHMRIVLTVTRMKRMEIVPMQIIDDVTVDEMELLHREIVLTVMRLCYC